ncbi:M20 family metallopeptidase [Candidatus Latescibacterota bacterium]
MDDRITALADRVTARVTDIRHDIHRHPETGYHETRTAVLVESFLDELGISHRRYGGTGVVGQIGEGSGHVVGLRSEMDALPTDDLSGVPYSSEHKGIAHACGHDGHIAILLGTACVLKQLEGELDGTVKLIWQPAEEGGGGAAKMIEDGVLEPPVPEAIFAIHGWPGLGLGKAAYRFGPAMASVDNFEITVTGRSAHAAMPSAGIDPIPIAARIVDGIQSIRSRMIDPMKPSVITVSTIHGGSAVNVIPDEVKLTGTIRTLDPHTRHTIPELMQRMVEHTAGAAGGQGTFTLKDGYPPTINESRATEFAREAITEILGSDNCQEIPEPVMGGEDFAYFLEKIPGSFLRLGVGDRPGLHNSRYDFNDAAIPTGIRIMTGIAVKFCRVGLPT